MLLRIVLIFLAANVQTLFADKIICEQRTAYSGKISYSKSGYGSVQKCWTIAVPENKYVRLAPITVQAPKLSCGNGHVEIIVPAENSKFRFCHEDENKALTSLNTVTVDFYLSFSNQYGSGSVNIEYKIEDVLCAKDDSFRCSPHVCIHQSKVCDGIKDCEDGRDEKDCNVKVIEDKMASRLDAISWLKEERSTSGLWHKNTPRAITALYLADGIEANGTCPEKEMLHKELELRTSVAILRNGTDRVSPSELAMFVHALLVSCRNPREFYGFDLVRLLREQAEGGNAHPLASLALCNAEEPLPEREVKRLEGILASRSAQPFLLDIQAVAVMALTCVKNRGKHPHLQYSLNSTITRFQKLQKEDGSFGNTYTTAFITQALLGSGERNNSNWRMEDAVMYLMKQQAADSSFGDFLATYLILPILNSKSLVDVARVDCSGSYNPDDDLENKLGPKMYVKYSLLIGDALDVIHSISLRAPVSITVLDVMKLAATADPKFKFESQLVDNKVYVFSISGIANDPEAGKFWMLHLGRIEKNETIVEVSESPEKRIVQDGEHVIMWYMSAFI